MSTVLSFDVGGEGGVDGIAKVLAQHGHFGGHVGRIDPAVLPRHGDVLRKRTVAIDADDLGFRRHVAQVAFVILAVVVDDVAFARDEIAHFALGDFAAHLHDVAADFVTLDQRHGFHASLRPGVPVVDVQIGAADRCGADFDQNVIRADHRDVALQQGEAGLAFGFDQGFHGVAHTHSLRGWI